MRRAKTSIQRGWTAGQAGYAPAYVTLAAVLTAVACGPKVQFSGNSLDKTQPVVVIDQEFPAATLGSETTHFKPNFGLVEQSITLKERGPLTTSRQQLVRPTVRQDDIRQGTTGKVETPPAYTISTATKMDLLVVLDNSGSMSGEATLLAQGLDAFTSALGNVDWRIGVITSDSEPSDDSPVQDIGCHLYGPMGVPTGAPILKSDPQADSIFLSTITNIAGKTGSNREQSLRNALKAVTGTCTGLQDQKWLRQDAMLGILFITDEDSYCMTSDMHTPNPIKDFGSDKCKAGERPEDLIRALQPPFRPADQVRVYSLTYQGTAPVWPDNRTQRPAPRVLQVVHAFGGFDDSILQGDYTNTLKHISQDAASVVKHQFILDYTPIPSTLVVMVDGQVTTDYTLVGNKVILNNVDDSQQKMTVHYAHDPVPILTTFPLTKGAPDLATLHVKVFGLEQVSGWSYVATPAPSIVFEKAPFNNAPIEFDYTAANPPLLKSFDFSALAIDKPLQITVGGAPATAYSWDATTHVATFATPPADGAVIAVQYPNPEPKVTSYALTPSAGGAQPLSITVKDAATQAQLAVQESGDNIIFDAKDVVDGRTATVTYNYGDAKTVLEHELANPPIPGSVTLKVDDGSPNCVHDTKVEGQKVIFTCDAAELGELALSYKYLIDKRTSFTLSQDIPAQGYMQVFVDGQAYNNYQVSGRTITLPADATSLTSKVHVIVTSLQAAAAL